MSRFITFNNEDVFNFYNESKEEVLDWLRFNSIKINIETISLAEFMGLYNKMERETDNTYAFGNIYGISLDNIYFGNDSVDNYIMNYFLEANLTNIFVAAFRTKYYEDDDISLQSRAQIIFKNMVANGANKEMVHLSLLRAELNKNRNIRDLESENPQDKELLAIEKEMLKENLNLQTKLSLIRSPYDKLFEVSAEIADLKKEERILNNKTDLTEDELKKHDTIQDELIKKEEWLAIEMKKYDPNIILDVVNYKMECFNLEEQILEEKKGIIRKEGEIKLASTEEKQLMDDLHAIKKQCRIDIKFLEKCNEHEV